jgi:DNA-binding response OmpR family regulator
VLEASDGAEATNVLAEARPDLFIVDWDLPGVSGEDVIRAARTISSSPAPRIPILLMLARPRRSVVERAADLGVNEVIAKPFSPAVLWSRLDEVVRRPRPFIAQGDLVRPQARGAALTGV